MDDSQAQGVIASRLERGMKRRCLSVPAKTRISRQRIRVIASTLRLGVQKVLFKNIRDNRALVPARAHQVTALRGPNLSPTPTAARSSRESSRTQLLPRGDRCIRSL